MEKILKYEAYLEIEIEDLINNWASKGWNSQEWRFSVARPYPRTTLEEITNEVYAIPRGRKFHTPKQPRCVRIMINPRVCVAG